MVTDSKANYIAHYVNGATGDYLYSIPYYWPCENDQTRERLFPNAKYRTLKEYEEGKK